MILRSRVPSTGCKLPHEGNPYIPYKGQQNMTAVELRSKKNNQKRKVHLQYTHNVIHTKKGMSRLRTKYEASHVDC